MSREVISVNLFTTKHIQNRKPLGPLSNDIHRSNMKLPNKATSVETVGGKYCIPLTWTGMRVQSV